MVPAAAVIASAASEVPVAARGGRPKTATSNGTTTIPPPTPNNALKTPATKPIASRRTIHSYRMKVGADDLLALLAERPAEAGLLLGVDGPAYVGVHGLELAPEAERWRGPLHEFAASVDWPVEDKGLAVVFHYRGADDERAALAMLRRVAERASELGLEPQFGRKVLEVRPPVAADKGTAVRTLLARHDLRRGLHAGDDTTDLDAVDPREPSGRKQLFELP